MIRFLRITLLFVPLVSFTPMVDFNSLALLHQQGNYALPFSLVPELYTTYQRLISDQKEADSLFHKAKQLFRESNKLRLLAFETKSNNLRQKALTNADKLAESATENRDKAYQVVFSIINELHSVIDQQIVQLPCYKGNDLVIDSLTKASRQELSRASQLINKRVSYDENSEVQRLEGIRTGVNALRMMHNSYCSCVGLFTNQTVDSLFEYNTTYRIVVSSSDYPITQKEMDTLRIANQPLYLEIDDQKFNYFIGEFFSLDEAVLFTKEFQLDSAAITPATGSLPIILDIPDVQSNSIVYRLQVGAMKDSIQQKKLADWQSRFDIIIDTVDGYFKLKIGNFATYKQATQFKLKHNLGEAFVVVDSL